MDDNFHLHPTKMFENALRTEGRMIFQQDKT